MNTKINLKERQKITVKPIVNRRLKIMTCFTLKIHCEAINRTKDKFLTPLDS